MDTIRNGTLCFGNGIGNITVGGHIHQTILGLVQFPTVVDHFLGLRSTTVDALIVQHTVNGHTGTIVMQQLGQRLVVGRAAAAGIGLIARLGAGGRLGGAHLVVVGMTIRIFIDLQILQLHALHRMAAGAQITQGQRLAAEPVIDGSGVGTSIVLDVQRTDLSAVDHQIGHIGTVCIHAVLNAVNVGSS